MKDLKLAEYRKLMIGADVQLASLFKFFPITTRESGDHKQLNPFLIDSLMHHYLWHASPETLNDPFDCYNQLVSYGQPDYETIKWIVQRSGIKKPDEALNEVFRLWNEPEELIRAYRSTTPVWNVCSFTDNQLSKTMWSHYADSHSGLCLEFDNLKLASCGILACKVRYETTFTPLDFFQHPEESILRMVTTKTEDWKHESEFRSFNERLGKHYYDKSCIVGITFGCNASQANIESIINTLKKAGLNGIRLSQAKMNPNSFDLAFLPIDDMR